MTTLHAVALARYLRHVTLGSLAVRRAASRGALLNLCLLSSSDPAVAASCQKCRPAPAAGESMTLVRMPRLTLMQGQGGRSCVRGNLLDTGTMQGVLDRRIDSWRSSPRDSYEMDADGARISLSLATIAFIHARGYSAYLDRAGRFPGRT